MVTVKDRWWLMASCRAVRQSCPQASQNVRSLNADRASTTGRASKMASPAVIVKTKTISYKVKPLLCRLINDGFQGDVFAFRLVDLLLS